MTSFGKLEMNKQHVFCKNTDRFCITQRIQNLMCLLGQSKVYEEASEVFSELMDIDISGMQIQRVCNHYGQTLNGLINKNAEESIMELEKVRQEDNIYVMVDGAMIYTKEEEWKEIKLGRIFNSRDVVEIQKGRSEITNSIYVSHVGSVKEFFPKLEWHLVPYRKKIVIGDGAKWIWNWVEDNYPGAIQILDFFHAKEKLVIFSKYQFKEEDRQKKWLDEQIRKLLNNQSEQVIAELKGIRANNILAKEAKQKAIAYYIEHDDRMQYKTFLDKGLMIGSGPIEAAHRSVIQQRMKLSGQKWSIKGAQAIATLRCYKKSKAWEIVKNLIAAA